MKPQVHVIYNGLIQITELNSAFDQPRRPRDFNFEGSFYDLSKELIKDFKTLDGCGRYVVYADYNESAPLWTIWRDQP